MKFEVIFYTHLSSNVLVILFIFYKRFNVYNLTNDNCEFYACNGENTNAIVCYILIWRIINIIFLIKLSKWSKDYKEAIKRARTIFLRGLILWFIIVPWFVYLIIY